MITKDEIIAEAHKCGFEDIGFTTADSFDSHLEFLKKHPNEYGWANDLLKLQDGTNPATVLPGAKTIIVLMEIYFRKSYPRSMEGNFGRCYLDDDRVTKDGLALRIKSFRSFLRDNGIDSKVPFNIPHRMAAARAGLGTFGKNCLFYSNKVARKSSWNLPIAVVIDHEFEADEGKVEIGCPDWCRNVCISACPTRALKKKCEIDPRKCISYLSYFGEGITPLELREPMGMFIYGCDRCQNVCPRNQPWLSQGLPENERVMAKADDFDLSKLIHMDKEYFDGKIWPHMFYMSYDDIWRWKMNVARVMGNSQDVIYIGDLIKAYKENDDERVRGMCAWALGRLGGPEAKSALEEFLNSSDGPVRKEVQLALKQF